MVTRHPGSLEINPSAYKVFTNVFPFVCLTLSFFLAGVNCLGYTTTIAASYGDLEQVCAIEANGDQVLLCWGKNISQRVYPSAAQVPYAFAVISGGNGFMCGLKAGTYSPYCWSGNISNTYVTTPDALANFSYSTISAGEGHVCGIRSMSNEAYPGKVDCWGMDHAGETFPPGNLHLSSIVAGESYTCGLDNYTHYAHCWGAPQVSTTPNAEFESLSAGTHHVCGILKGSNRVKCWGDNSMMQATPPVNINLVAVTSGLYHSCGITADTHEVVCWGDTSFDTFSPAPGASFLTLTSGPNITCGIREDNLHAACWGNGAVEPNYLPPLELFSPGICTSNPCKSGTFDFNASAVVSMGSSGYRKICMGATEQICAPCAWSCPVGQFLSGPCSLDADRSCSYCSLCTSDSCRASCDRTNFSAASPLQSKSSSSGKTGNAAPIIGAAVSGGLLVAVIGALILCVIYSERFGYRFWGCASREKLFDCGGAVLSSTIPTASSGRTNGSPHDVIRMQAFRLAELRDATNGFKELNELGRGSYGFVYKALLSDGRQVAVKRANAARRIRSRSRDFEAELEVLCKVHHAHLVNLVGYCEEMGERLLVYEFMPHGTLHDHLHGGLIQLNWHLRLKIAAQAARGIEYLHKDASPRIIHRDVKSSNVLLDGEWGARVADFGLTLPEREKGPPPSVKPPDVAYVDPDYIRSQNYTEKSDVYSFGVVLLEILCGRKAYDSDFDPANIVEWAVPYIRRGNTVQILDRSLDLPKNVEPLMRVAEIVELCVRFSPQERPSMSDVASWLELVGRSSSMSVE